MGGELRMYITEKFMEGCDAARFVDGCKVREYEHDVIRGIYNVNRCGHRTAQS